jgi:hypothetical protein
MGSNLRPSLLKVSGMIGEGEDGDGDIFQVLRGGIASLMTILKNSVLAMVSLLKALSHIDEKKPSIMMIII